MSSNSLWEVSDLTYHPQFRFTPFCLLHPPKLPSNNRFSLTQHYVHTPPSPHPPSFWQPCAYLFCFSLEAIWVFSASYSLPITFPQNWRGSFDKGLLQQDISLLRFQQRIGLEQMVAECRSGSVFCPSSQVNLLRLKKCLGLTSTQSHHSGLWMKVVSAGLVKTTFRSVPHRG